MERLCRDPPRLRGVKSVGEYARKGQPSGAALFRGNLGERLCRRVDGVLHVLGVPASARVRLLQLRAELAFDVVIHLLIVSFAVLWEQLTTFLVHVVVRHGLADGLDRDLTFDVQRVVKQLDTGLLEGTRCAGRRRHVCHVKAAELTRRFYLIRSDWRHELSRAAPLLPRSFVADAVVAVLPCELDYGRQVAQRAVVHA